MPPTPRLLLTVNRAGALELNGTVLDAAGRRRLAAALAGAQPPTGAWIALRGPAQLVAQVATLLAHPDREPRFVPARWRQAMILGLTAPALARLAAA